MKTLTLAVRRRMRSGVNPELFSWCEVSEAALRQNVAALKRRLGPGKKLGVVVKADAYGHGLDVAAPVFVNAGVDWLVVNAAREAKAVRAVVDKDVAVYICGPVLDFEADVVVAAGARVVVVDEAVVDALGRASVERGVVTPVHIKVETGTHRQGLLEGDVVRLAEHVKRTPGVVLEGLTTHYADIEDTTDHRFADSQLERLLSARAAVEKVHGPLMVHSANSAATLLDERTHGDLVRVGIASYGLWPSKETQAAWLERRLAASLSAASSSSASSPSTLPGPADETLGPTLAPVLSWRALLAQVKDVPRGGFVGYGRTYRATHDSRIAIVPVGYHEGYDRRLSNVAHVLVDGVRCPVRGRVCMNMIMVDVTDVPGARPGMVATLLGSDGDERISAEQLAGWMGTIHYEAVSRIHPSVPRLLAP